MAVRKIIEIDDDKCTGCGICVPNCHEGALQIIDGKARLISDLFCDGLGACIGECPEHAIEVIEREAEDYDERRVMKENIVPKGENTIKAHLNHLREHGATKFYDQAVEYLEEVGVDNPVEKENVKSHEHGHGCHSGGCPGSRTMTIDRDEDNVSNGREVEARSELAQWPVQLHLVSPHAPYFEGADVLLAADCTAFALGSFHDKLLKGKAIAIACPKLDSDQDVYVDKLTAMIDQSKINTLTVAIMQVPCCGGLVSIAKEAVNNAERNVPVKKIVIGINGDLLSEDWV